MYTFVRRDTLFEVYRILSTQLNYIAFVILIRVFQHYEKFKAYIKIQGTNDLDNNSGTMLKDDKFLEQNNLIEDNFHILTREDSVSAR